MLIFIPSNDLSETADVASSVTTLDLGYIQVGESKKVSFRLGNTDAAATVNYSISVDALVDWISITPSAVGSLSPQQCSDTLGITVAPPVFNAPTAMTTVAVNVHGAGATSSLDLTWTTVGVNEHRQSQYPERRTTFTDNVSNVIDRVGEELKIYRYDPVAYNPEDVRVIFDDEQTRNIEGEAGSHRWISQDSPESRLSPTDEIWGYVRSEEYPVASFHNETVDVETTFTNTNTMMNYTSTAFLVVGAEWEMTSIWALFAPANGVDPDQYKRTVFLFKRQGDIWCFHQVYSRYRGNEISHFEIELVQLHKSQMGDENYYNPFGWTYTKDTDKPYAMYPVSYGTLFEELGTDISGSNSSNAFS